MLSTIGLLECIRKGAGISTQNLAMYASPCRLERSALVVITCLLLNAGPDHAIGQAAPKQFLQSLPLTFS